MSNAFAARYSITYVEDKGSGVWECTGKVYDDSTFSYLATDVVVGDVIIDESAFFGTTNRWKITQIVSAVVRDLVCRVVWDDTGTEDTNGPAASEAAIARPTTNYKIAEIPTQGFAKISEVLQTKLQNIDSRKNIDNISAAARTGAAVGTKDGVNATFTLPNGDTYVSGSLTVFLNGLAYIHANIQENGGLASFTIINSDILPISTDSLDVRYNV